MSSLVLSLIIHGHEKWNTDSNNVSEEKLWNLIFYTHRVENMIEHMLRQGSAINFPSPWTFYVTWQESLKSSSLLVTCSIFNIYFFSSACNSQFTSNISMNHVAKSSYRRWCSIQSYRLCRTTTSKEILKKMGREDCNWNHPSCSRPGSACDATAT